jgi:hypothetical protein
MKVMKTGRRQRLRIGSLLMTVSLATLLSGVLPAVDAAPAPHQKASRPSAQVQIPGFTVKDIDAENLKVAILDPTGKETILVLHQKAGAWALMGIIQDGGRRIAVFENVEDRKGDILYISNRGIEVVLPKSLERTSVPPESLYGGHKAEEIIKMRGGRDVGGGPDILGEEILAEPGDPTYERVKALLPPLHAPTFVGTRYSIDKPTWEYGAFSDEIYVDVGKVFKEIDAARKKFDVYEGIVGGWLPVPRWLFPAGENRYWDVVIFAEEDPTKFWTQPIWFRILLVENGQVKEAHHFYHHLPIPPRGEPKAEEFYKALLKVHREWNKALVPTLKIDLPEKMISDFCLHALATEMITRIGNHPKYGYPPLGGINVFGGYGYSNVDTFQDIFNSSVITFSEWGLFDIVRGYIDFYLANYVRDDGSIDTRGLETGQYGIMLAAVAKYYNYSRDADLILKHLTRIRGMIKYFDDLRAEAKKLPPADPAYGIIRGWSEHDSSLKFDPYDLIQPFLSNNAAASRGFSDIGKMFVEIGTKVSDKALVAEGQAMIREAGDMKKDLYASIEKSMRKNETPPGMPGTAGDVSNVFQGRVHAEMMQSGVLTKDQANSIARFHTDSARRLISRGGFLYYGFGYGILQHDWIREFILSYYSILAHGYTPGTWISVESAALDNSRYAPYATPSQLNIPVLTKWMLVFEDPNEPVLWLAKATPQQWLEPGKKIAVSGAPTRFGLVGFELRSDIAKGKVFGSISLPPGPDNPTVNVRIRVPGGKKMQRVLVNGKPWKAFDPALDIVVLDPSVEGLVEIEVFY